MSWRAYHNFGAENFCGIPTFNQYWTGGVPMGGDGYMAPFNGAMPYMCLTTGPFDAPSSRIPPQESFSAQGSMMPSFAQRKARVREVSSGGINDSPVKTKSSLTSQAAPVDRPDQEERSRHADKRMTDLRRHLSPRSTKHRVSSSEKHNLDLNRSSTPRQVKQRTSSPEKPKLYSSCYSSPRPAKQRASSPDLRKPDSSRHSLSRPDKQKASSPDKRIPDWRRHSSSRLAKQRGSSHDRDQKHNVFSCSPEKRIPDWRRHSSPRLAKQRASSHDRDQKHNVFSRISLDENGNKKRKATNGSKGDKVEQRSVGNGYWDEWNAEKRSEGGVSGLWWGGKSEDESSEEECHFKRRRRSPMRQPEDWNLPELDYAHGRADVICS